MTPPSGKYLALVTWWYGVYWKCRPEIPSSLTAISLSSIGWPRGICQRNLRRCKLGVIEHTSVTFPRTWNVKNFGVIARSVYILCKGDMGTLHSLSSPRDRALLSCFDGAFGNILLIRRLVVCNLAGRVLSLFDIVGSTARRRCPSRVC